MTQIEHLIELTVDALEEYVRGGIKVLRRLYLSNPIIKQGICYHPKLSQIHLLVCMKEGTGYCLGEAPRPEVLILSQRPTETNVFKQTKNKSSEPCSNGFVHRTIFECAVHGLNVTRGESDFFSSQLGNLVHPIETQGPHRRSRVLKTHSLRYIGQ